MNDLYSNIKSQLPDFSKLLTEDEVNKIIQDLSNEIVENAIEKLKKQVGWDGTTKLDKVSIEHLYFKGSMGYDLRTGIMKDLSLVSKSSYNISLGTTKQKSGIKTKAYIKVVGKALKRIKTLHYWGNQKGKNYMSWYIITDWSLLVKKLVYRLTLKIAKKLKK